MNDPKFTIGQQFKTRGKNPKICTIVEVLRTYNSKNELIEIRYVAEHTFMGQTVTERVPEITITMGKFPR